MSFLVLFFEIAMARTDGGIEASIEVCFPEDILWAINGFDSGRIHDLDLIRSDADPFAVLLMEG